MEESLPIIRRLNHHGQVVVRNAVDEVQSTSLDSAQVPKHKQLLREMTKLDDLEPVKVHAAVALDIQDQAGYSQGSASRNQNLSTQDVSAMQDDVSTSKQQRTLFYLC